MMAKYSLLEPLKHNGVVLPLGAIVDVDDGEASAFVSRRLMTAALESSVVTAGWPAEGDDARKVVTDKTQAVRDVGLMPSNPEAKGFLEITDDGSVVLADNVASSGLESNIKHASKRPPRKG